MSTAFQLTFLEILMFLGGVAFLTKEMFRELSWRRIEKDLFWEQLFQVGARSMPLVLITAIFTGMVMTLQFGIGLAKFGGTPYVPKIVSLSIVREMGPVFTAMMIAARVGAGFASEIGSMAVTQQIDAMRALGTSPIQKIVLPRVLACLVAVPLLAALANLLGVLGAMIVSVTELRLDPEFFFLKVLNTVTLADYLSGLGKTVFFALFVSVTCCYFGMKVKEGAREVGIATTKAVVYSCILILVGDYFLTKAFAIVEGVL